MSIIGKTYVSSDNSWTVNLDTDEWVPLAGTVNSLPVTAIIASDPYILDVSDICRISDKFTRTFINVTYKNETYRVLYDESRVGKTVESIDDDYLDYYDDRMSLEEFMLKF